MAVKIFLKVEMTSSSFVIKNYPLQSEINFIKQTKKNFFLKVEMNKIINISTENNEYQNVHRRFVLNNPIFIFKAQLPILLFFK